MPLTPNFSVSQNSGNLNLLTITDTSTGTPVSPITGRLVYLRKYDASYLVPEGYTTTYIFWPYVSGAGDTIEIDVLDKDYCLDITVQFYAGSGVDSSITILNYFIGYGQLFLRKLTQATAANRVTITAQNFWVNKNKLRVLLDDVIQAVELLNDQTIAQFCIDEEKKLTDNLPSFF